MKTYEMNVLQFGALPRILHTTQVSMADKLGLNKANLCRKLQDGDFRMHDILLICNEYHIRFSSFITTSIQNVDASAIVTDDNWKKIEFNPDKMKKRFGMAGITIANAAKMLGCSRPTVTNISDRSELSWILRICNTFGWNLGDFISDPTLPAIRKVDMNIINMELRTENAALRDEINELREYIRTHYSIIDMQPSLVAEQSKRLIK